MAISLKHAFTSNVADSGDATLVQPSNWNAEHSITMATSRLLGRTTAGTGAVEEISVAGNLTLSGGSLTGAEFPSGTRMLFQQTSAPTGWTKDTTASYNNTALRIVTGSITNYTAGSSFTTIFASPRTFSVSVSNTTSTGTVGGTTLTTAQMPSHTHTYGGGLQSNTTTGGTADRINRVVGPQDTTNTTTSNGSSNSHTHSLTMDSHTHTASGSIAMNVNYIDFIIASKD